MTAQGTAVPGPRGAAIGRGIGIGLMHGLWRPRVLGASRVPATGPVILAGNHSHNIDGPMIIGTSPRPLHFLVKKEAFVGPLDPFLRGIGQLPVDRSGPDRNALAAALGVLERGGALGIFPEGTRGVGDFAELRAGLAYFAVRSGAPVVPVAVLGSGHGRGLLPGLPRMHLAPLPLCPLFGHHKPDCRIDVVFGEPFEAGDGSGRRGRAALDAATTRIQERLTAHLEHARRITGRLD